MTMTETKKSSCETCTCGTTPAPALSEVMDLKQAAQYLGVKEHTMYYLIEHKMLRARRVGKEYRFLQSNLRDWLNMKDEQE